MVRDTIVHLKESGLQVFFDAEHFFDGYKKNSEYALQVLEAAAQAGAECLILCDTNGGSMPWEIAAIIDHVTDQDQCTAGDTIPTMIQQLVQSAIH
jgi:2-isopropylmalate synthase